MGIIVDDPDGSPAKAEGRIGVWCATYFQLLRAKRTTNVPLPPLVACTVVGVIFNLFTAYAIEGPGRESLRVVCMHFLFA